MHAMTHGDGGGGGPLGWFTGNGAYMRLADCMAGDTFWIVLTVGLDVAVAVGYLLIARHWGINERLLQESPAKSALRTMKRIFVFCGICGYLFIPIKMVWPAWRLYDMFTAVLVYLTWRYALGAHELRVVYEQLDRAALLSEELEQSREDARRKSIFLSSISHDLRTPLNGLMLHVDLAEMSASGGDAPGLRESLEAIRVCARSAADLLGEFLEIGRIDWASDAVRLETFPLGDLIDRVVEANRVQAAQRSLSLVADAPPGLSIRSDRRMVERILQNLVENGLKYTSRGEVRLAVVSSVPLVEVHVIDTGIGIAPAHQSLVFQDFYQVENRERDRAKGFGLGLSIAARLARQLGGELRLESEVGRGSRFILRLPTTVVVEQLADATDGRDRQGHALASPAPAAR